MTGALLAGAWLLATASGLPALALRRRPALGQRLAAAALCLAALLALAAAIPVLAGAPPFAVSLAWREPLASLSVRLDALSALFLVPVTAIPALGAVYGIAYWPQERRGAAAVRLQLAFGLVTGAMLAVVVADNGLLFLFAWEVMALAGYLLVLGGDGSPASRRAAWIYLAAAHVGGFAIFALFSAIGGMRGSFDFQAWRGLALPGGMWALALVGFGIKAGLVPLHFWLPEAHAAAPSHVSATMSGVLLKTGIYGLLRVSSFVEAPPASWGAALLVAGIASAVLGVALALAQHDLKRLLAYHSVENVGIIAMGAGLAMLGRARGAPALVVLGFGGAALHVVNHALFKSLLFLGAGSVLHGAGTREIPHLGGLARRMPRTSALFLAGAAAISGLPPLNGFVSEWLVLMAGLGALALPAGDRASFAALAVPSLALVGALAAACFVKVQGSVFLGPARSPGAEAAHESPAAMLAPMALLAAACVAIGLSPALLLPALARGAAAWSGMPATALLPEATGAATAAGWIGAGAISLMVIVGALWALRRRLAAAHPPAPQVETWGCGFARPTARMSYTASSFAQILTGGFRWALWPRVRLVPPRGAFPGAARFSIAPREAVLEVALGGAVRGYSRAAARVRGLLAGGIHFYALLVLATLVALLAWRLLWW